MFCATQKESLCERKKIFGEKTREKANRLPSLSCKSFTTIEYRNFYTVSCCYIPRVRARFNRPRFLSEQSPSQVFSRLTPPKRVFFKSPLDIRGHIVWSLGMRHLYRVFGIKHFSFYKFYFIKSFYSTREHNIINTVVVKYFWDVNEWTVLRKMVFIERGNRIFSHRKMCSPFIGDYLKYIKIMILTIYAL